MIVCSRCITLLAPGSQVCTGCGLPLGAEATPLAAPAIEASAPPAQSYRAPDNPWRHEQTEAVEHPTIEIPSAPGPQGQLMVTAELATPASKGPLLAFDPLPPAAPTENPDPYLTSAVAQATPEGPAIGVEVSDGSGAVRGITHCTEDTLAVPAAYATFAPEVTQHVSSYLPESGAADVVELTFPAVLTVAPPSAPVESWPIPDEQRRSAEGL